MEPVRSLLLISSKPHQRPQRDKSGQFLRTCAYESPQYTQGIWVSCADVHPNFEVISNLVFCYVRRSSLATAGDSGKCLQIRAMALLITSLLLDVGVKNALRSRVLGAHGRSEHRACRTLALEKRIHLRRQTGLRKSCPGGHLEKSSCCEKSETQPTPQDPRRMQKRMADTPMLAGRGVQG